MQELVDELDVLPLDGKAGEGARILVIPARTQIDLTTSEYVAQAISASTAGIAEAAAESIGLTAISQASQAQQMLPDAVVLVSTGGIEDPDLALLWNRMVKSFAGRPLYVLDLAGISYSVRPQSSNDDIKPNSHRGLATVLRHPPSCGNSESRDFPGCIISCGFSRTGMRSHSSAANNAEI